MAVRVNDRVDLDPSFGDIVPGECDAFWVMVTPESTKAVRLTDYFFILLLPCLEDEEGTRELIKDCMAEALSTGDSYSSKGIKHEDLDKFDQTTPILSFDPKRLEATGDIDLVWLRPPKELMQ